jgi:ABC-type microcin C transport system permease subunit YejE
MTYGFFASFILNRFSVIKNPVIGLQIGAVIGFFSSLSMNLFLYSTIPVNYQTMAIDILIAVVTGACVGTAIALVNGKLN